MMDTSCKKVKDVTLDQISRATVGVFQSNQHQASKDSSKVHAHPDARSTSPCRILTTASSSGSDPLASPSNEAASDGDMQTEHPMQIAGPSNVSVLTGMPFGISNPVVQARITLLEKQFLMQKEILSRQFEEQCRLLDNEQQVKVQEYLKLLGQHHQKEEMSSELKKKIEEEQMMKYKKKRKTDESAVASTAVKLKLRECLLNKSRAEHQASTDSPPELRQWSTQHSSLDQHSPPTNTKWSPPLHVLNRFEDEYPLRKTVSEPTLKMKSCKMSLRQRVMQRNNPQLKRREMYRKKNIAMLDHDSSPNSPPLFDSHGSSVDESKGPQVLENRIQEVAKNVQLGDNYNSQLVAMGLQGLKKELMAPGHYGSLPIVGGRGGFPISTRDVAAMSANKPSGDSGCGGDTASLTSLCSGLSAGVPSLHGGTDALGLTEAYVQALMLARSSLPRTRSEPIPLPVQLLLQQQLLKSHEYLQKDPNKYFFKQQVGGKKLMENVDESVERQIPFQEHVGCSVESEEEVDIIVVDDAAKNHSGTALVYDLNMLKHTCCCQNNSCHPEKPERLTAIWSHFKESGYIEKCQLIKSRRAMKEELETCHSEAYVQMYGSANRPRDLVYETFALRFCQLPCGGIGVDSDTVWNEYHTATAARIAAGCAIELSHKVATGEVKNGFAIIRPPGHHAEDMQAMGFCYFNSIGIATKQLLDKLHMQRILILDWDVHHGNSTQQLFYADPRVLYISLHRYDNGNFFPGTGDPGECGIDKGEGFNVNIGWCEVPMADAEYLAAFRSIVMPIAREFQPEMVMVSAGFDAAKGHPAPLGGYNLSPECFGYMTRQLMTLANEKIVLLLEGGYELVPLAESALACLKALLNEPLSLIAPSELCRPPCQQSIKTLLTALKYQVNYWPCLRQYSESIVWSHLESQQKWSHMNLPFF